MYIFLDEFHVPCFDQELPRESREIIRDKVTLIFQACFPTLIVIKASNNPIFPNPAIRRFEGTCVWNIIFNIRRGTAEENLSCDQMKEMFKMYQPPNCELYSAVLEGQLWHTRYGIRDCECFAYNPFLMQRRKMREISNLFSGFTLQ